MSKENTDNSSKDYGPQANNIVSFFSGRLFWGICLLLCLLGITYGLITGGLFPDQDRPGVDKWMQNRTQKVAPAQNETSRRQLEKSGAYQRFKASK